MNISMSCALCPLPEAVKMKPVWNLISNIEENTSTCSTNTCINVKVIFLVLKGNAQKILRSQLVLSKSKQTEGPKGLFETFITPRISSRGNRIGPVCVCPSVCYSVRLQLNRVTYGLEIWCGDEL